MDDNMSTRRQQKRPIEADADDDNRWKKQLVVKHEGDMVVVPRVYNFRVLLPNGTSLGITVRSPNNLMTLHQFLGKVKEEYYRETEVVKPRRGVNWSSPDLFLIDASDNRLRKCIDFNKFQPNKIHILRLNDGTKAANMYKNMWDLTPDTDLLKELPEEYTFETALADLIDNSLQAVWSNGVKTKKLISVEVSKDKISIFDTGPGMDNSEENSIVKWGKMGASLHRSCRGKAIGGKPPYLNPAFGMFGYGGPIASMHLGRRAEVSSRTKDSKKVYLLELEREALLNRSGSKKTWRTAGNFRDPLEDEISRSLDGSFTKVDIFEPKMRSMDISRLRCKLKDIYFPYIQCDELSKSGRTITPIEFQVNGTDLAEVDGGEVATANLHSCNGPEFVLQLRFHFNQDSGASSSPGARASFEANARLKCVYFPVIEGKESIKSILEKLEKQEYGITEKYESFSRVSVRRLGRLLPDARWTLLPFMDLRQRKGDKAQVLKRCCLRVKCFIDTDAGFNPTPSKTDLAHQSPYTNALKNFGNKQPLGKERDIQIEIKSDGKPLTLLQLDKQYQDWIIQMHGRYDEEVVCGVDEPVIIVCPSNLKELGISTNVVRVHELLRRKGTSWKSGQKIKVLKGACAGCHKSNFYATLEFFLLEGFQGDAGGEARLICRPIHIPETNGCRLTNKYGNPRLDLRKSTMLPISVIDSGKCLAMESVEWDSLLHKQHQKSPSSIEILSAKYCQQLGIEVALPVENIVDAGHVPPDKVVALIRPASFSAGSTSENLDQKYIVKENFEMALEVKFVAEDKDLQDEGHKYSGREPPSSLGGFHGLYVFQLKCKSPPLFQKAGVYTFSFSLRESSCINLVKEIQVKGLSEVQRCGILRRRQVSNCILRVGSFFPPFSIASYDRYDNQIQVTKVPEFVVKVCSNRVTLADIGKVNVSISSNGSALRVEDMRIESSELDCIRPSYEATLMICQRHGLFPVDIPFKVYPGCLDQVKLRPTNPEKQLLPGHVIKELVLEMFDVYGNHMRENEEILLKVDGFCFLDKAASVRKVDNQGCVDLSGLLKVTKGYGETDMNLDQNLEDMDDDLELLGSPTATTPKSTTGTNASVGQSVTINKSKGKSTREDRLDSEDFDETDAKKGRSDVWQFFLRLGVVDGVEKCKCKRCKKVYTCKSASGTTHLRRHVPKCYNNPQYHDVSSLLDNQDTLLKKWKFDSKGYRDALSRCIIMHDLPFSYAEYEGVSAVNKILNHEFKPVSRNTAKADCKNVFLSEKAKLKSVLATLRGRICLTSDVWTAVTTQGYMAVTAHYIDENWKLSSKLLSFCVLESPHTGLELSSRLLGVLKDWGIDSKIFSITLDNASNNDSMQKILRERLNLQNGLLCRGEFFHVRCCAHILNIIVQEGLKATGKALEKIRESVKYVRSSEGRLQQFQICIEEVHLSNVGGSFLRLDVATRWNATYMMLESAIKYRRAFTSLSYNDRNYKFCPTNEEWERAERVCAFLAPFYHITNLVSGSSYPTSNLYFMQVASIEMKLNENLACEDEVIKDMALRMKGKFDKYWNEYSVTLALGCVLDPKAKLQFLNFCYRRLYPLDYQEKVNRVKEALYKLFGEYECNGAASSSFPPNSSREGNNLSRSQPPRPMESGSSSSSMPSILDEYQHEMRQMNSSESKSQLDSYLEEGCSVEVDIDVLQYWRMNRYRFPQLATMACDVLSIPITTVASESSFSIGGRILHKYRNCLLPENVQALICTRSWLHGFKELGPSDAQEVEEIQLSKEDSNVILEVDDDDD